MNAKNEINGCNACSVGKTRGITALYQKLLVANLPREKRQEKSLQRFI